MTFEQCRALVDDAKKEYHLLRTGGKARVIVDKDGSRVEFAAANIAGLYSYIQELEVMCPLPVEGVRSTRGPARFTF